jgi:hypothetical protein
MKLGIVLHKDDAPNFDELIETGAVTLIRRQGLLCEVDSAAYPLVKARLGRSVVVPTSYSMYDKAIF